MNNVSEQKWNKRMKKLNLLVMSNLEEGGKWIERIRILLGQRISREKDGKYNSTTRSVAFLDLQILDELITWR